MVAITKELFTEIIESLRDQYDYDVATTNTLGKVLKADDLLMYDNTKLTDSLFAVLGLHFPTKANYIKEFCYELDFGRVLNPGGAIEELWNELIGKETWYEQSEKKTKELLLSKMTDQVLSGSRTSTYNLKDYKKQETITIKREKVDVNEIEVKDFVVISPLKYSLED